jgi:hypothetical protein
MARGIDAAAHRTALEERGNTVAVLGTGVDVPYPVGHRQLHRAIGDHGLLLSENPLTDIHNTRRISAVVANGRLFDRKDLDAMLAAVEAAAKTVK